MTDQPGPAPRRRGSGAGLPLGRLAGIPIHIAPSWFVIAVVLTVNLGPDVAARLPGIGPARYLVAAAFVILLYASVLLHELGHCVVARALGLRVRRILLQLFGGLSEIDGEVGSPDREYLVAVAGPLVSLLLAGVGAAGFRALSTGSVARFMAAELAVANLLVTAFNLLPGLPLDGGRVLRAVLWRVFGSQLSATVAAAWVGRAVGVTVAVFPYGLSAATQLPPSPLSALYFGLLGVFLYAGATITLRQARVGAVLPALRVRQLARQALTVTADLPVSEAVRRAQDTGVRALVTVDGRGRLDGLVSEAAVIALPVERRPWISIGSLARRIDTGLVLPVDLAGRDLLDALARTPASEYLIVENSGGMFGVLTQADVAAALQTAG
ncbi:MAG TPA: site-2 protease family protein [Mycobacteriales bacterium]|nr:site-2 protease family protein [Mycobacteriales bacterium]